MRMGVTAGVGVLGLILLAILIFLAFSSPAPLLSSSQAAGPSQPIAFSHKIHAGQYKVDCQYCHSDARRSEYAGIPSVSRCMGCHKITAADRAEIKKLAEYFNRKEPIPWIRIFKVPEYVYFPHKAHIRAEVTCQNCHGPIENMDVVSAKTGQNFVNDFMNLTGLARSSPPLTMGWCIECHREKKATLDCMTCHH